ncbi:hypothetical protein C7999DRAFT_33668 [Corynascus novoguineensis]|uniref:DUF7689 domain-containing protein n=1 Tax=Corynascus novoguineensis TaxID=1126955 RepID=A0AAN7CPL6_9PEZI|nr:hypothetical protein C7999DRAFT_33668 [Corynascus novoguineensis]
MAANRQTPEERFIAWIQSRFEWAQPGTYNIIPDTQTDVPNCFAYAVGVYDRAIRPDTWADLDEEYGRLGYHVTHDDTNMDGDVQVYAKPSDLNRPLHAHRITDAATMTCESKMGADFAIQHHQNLLQCKRPDSSQMEYSTAVTRYRYDAARHQKYLEEEVTTSTGRKLKRKDTSFTESGRPIAKQNAAVTKSGKITKKKGAKRGPVKTKPVPSYSAGGFKRPTARVTPTRFARAAGKPQVAAAKPQVAAAQPHGVVRPRVATARPQVVTANAPARKGLYPRDEGVGSNRGAG